MDSADVQAFYEAARGPGGSYRGQLEPPFQDALVRTFTPGRAEDCEFYHAMAFPSGEVRPGVWDLRGGERTYLGFVDVSGQRVLELGPATGHLTFHMERQGVGADVIAFDVAPGVPTDIVPQEGHDLAAHRRLIVDYTERVRGSWWYARKALGSKARAVYGDIYALPGDLGRFDVCVFASILIHLSRPFHALQQAASLTDKAVVVTEPLPRIPADPRAALLEFAPVDTARSVVVWWQPTPGAIVRMLQVLGFLEFTVLYHTQRHHVHHEMDKPAAESLFFTVVAERHAGWAPRLPRTDAEVAREAEIRRAWASPPSAADALAAELGRLQSSVSWRLTRPVRAMGDLLRRSGLR